MANRQFVEELHGCMRLPVIVAPMFLISGPKLVSAAAKAGIIGCFPAPNAREIETLKVWLQEIHSDLKDTPQEGMWGINMIVHKSYDRFEEELTLIEQYKPKFVVTALGNPARVLDRVHAFGGKVFADVINVQQARKAIAAGVDGLILVCAGAGGHTGNYSPFSFVEEVRAFYDGPLLVGGAVQNARTISALMALGADFAYMGTRFIGCFESLVVDEYRDLLVEATMEDIITTDQVSGIRANWIRQSLLKSGYDLDETKGGQATIDFSNLHGDSKAWKHTWGAGHGVGATRSKQSVQEVVDDLVNDYESVQQDIISAINAWPKKS